MYARTRLTHSLCVQFKTGLLEITSQLKLGSPLEFDTFLSAVIDAPSYERNKSSLDYARQDSSHEILIGGGADDSKGYFIQPTIVQASQPTSRLMTNEIFGPILTVYVYDDHQVDETINLIDQSTPFALTGSIFATDK